MPTFLASVHVALKPTVNDPEGLVIRGGLHQLGFDSVEDVRSGKSLQIRLSERDEAAARDKVDAMCRRLLANPVIEQYRFELAEIQGEIPA